MYFMPLNLIKETLSKALGQAKLDQNERLLDVIRKLDQLTKDHKKKLPKQLVHFLEKRSYYKASDFINSN